MNIFETFSLAIKNILSSKMRTFLTMLGIIIGISAVIVITGLGNGMETYMRDSFAELGTNLLQVNIQGRGSARNVSIDQMYEIVQKYPKYFEYLSPSVTVNATKRIGTETITSATTGVSEDYIYIKAYKIAQGRNFEYMDIVDRKKVCIIGEYINTTYYGGKALGDSIRIDAEKLTIIGIAEQKKDEMKEGGTDDFIFIPYTTAARLSRTRVRNYVVSAPNEDLMAESKSILENALYKIFEDEDAYTVLSMTEVLEMLNSMIGIVITILVIIAGISLVVGGIGIMNIMLVSVTERTREIGIRKALGAKERVILSQFVIEAATTSALGGVLGIVVGFLLSGVATKIVTALNSDPITVSPAVNSVVMAFAVSVGIGILFGYLPAKKAARLNPIDALRYE
ncbi:MAG: ABC transporter permease [Clostridia bacterium]|nr:ABC transporter permease [Clostridia bacterium]